MKTIPSTLLTLTLIAGCTAGTGTGSPPQLNHGAPPSPSAAPTTGASLKAQVTIPVGKAPHGAAFSQGFIYIGNTGSGDISVIDTATDTKVTDLKVGGTPSYTKATPDGKFVANVDTTGKVRFIDPTGGQHTVVQTVEVGGGLDKLYFTADGKQMAVSMPKGNLLPVFTFATDYRVAPGRRDVTIGNQVDGHRGLSVHDGYALIPNLGDNTVSLANLVTNAARTISAGNKPSVVALANPGTGLTAIIGNAASNTISFTVAAGGDVATIAGGTSPTDIAVRADGKIAFITNSGSNDVSVVDVAARKELSRVPAGLRPVHIYQAPAVTPMAVKHEGHDDASPGGWILALNDAGDSVTVIDPVTYQVRATVAVGKGHHKCAFSATKAYVTNITSGDVSVIDLAAIK
jgi:YVTN family beta-propeller protein